MGEACHVLDFFCWLLELRPIRLTAEGGDLTHPGKDIVDNAIITISFADKSLASLIYTDMAGLDFPKERIEIFRGGLDLTLDNFQTLKSVGLGSKNYVLPRPDKGHYRQFLQLARWISGDSDHFTNAIDAARATFLTFKALDALNTNQPQDLGGDLSWLGW